MNDDTIRRTILVGISLKIILMGILSQPWYELQSQPPHRLSCAHFVLPKGAKIKQQKVGQSLDKDFDSLILLNEKIGEAEEHGDRTFLDGILAPALAFRRANPQGTIVDRKAFLDDVKQSVPRTTEVESVAYLGAKRALVTCVVTIKVDGTPQRFHNLRLFVRVEQEWKLLAWANEAIP